MTLAYVDDCHDSATFIIICPIAIAYSMGKIIKSVCVRQSVRVSVCLYSHGAFLGRFSPILAQTKEPFFQPARDCYGLRGHNLKIFVNRSRLNCRKYFFSQRSVGEWNRLPQEVVDAPSVNAFKNRLDHFWTDVST